MCWFFACYIQASEEMPCGTQTHTNIYVPATSHSLEWIRMHNIYAVSLLNTHIQCICTTLFPWQYGRLFYLNLMLDQCVSCYMLPLLLSLVPCSRCFCSSCPVSRIYRWCSRRHISKYRTNVIRRMTFPSILYGWPSLCQLPISLCGNCQFTWASFVLKLSKL